MDTEILNQSFFSGLTSLRLIKNMLTNSKELSIEEGKVFNWHVQIKPDFQSSDIKVHHKTSLIHDTSIKGLT